MRQLKPKLLEAVKTYTKKQLMQDMVGGVIVAVIAFPLSIALAIASGLSPEKGLYAAIIGGFFVSLLSGSHVQIGGITAATVMTVFTIVESFGLAGLAVATIMAGVFLIIMGLIKFGSLLKFIPITITTGFTAAIAMGIFSGQLKAFFGFEMGEVPVKVLDKFLAYAKVVHTLDWTSLAVGVLTIAILVFWPKIPKINVIPGSLAAILISTLVVQLAHLDTASIQTVYGQIPGHFPAFTVPDFDWSMVAQLVGPALTLAILIAIVSLLSCVVTDSLTGVPHDSNTELVAQGVANIFCGFFGAAPVAGAVARSTTGVNNGGSTPVVGIVHSIVVCGILLLMMPLAGYIPMPALAGILIVVSYNMSNWREIVYLLKNAPRSDSCVLIATLGFGIFVDLLTAVEVGVVLASLLLMKKMSDVTEVTGWKHLENTDPSQDIDSIRLKHVPDNTMVFEFNGPMFFAAADEMLAIQTEEHKNVIILRMRSVPAMDISGLRSLKGFYNTCKHKKITLILSHVNAQPMKVMEKAGFVEELGRDNFCSNIDKALERAQSLS